MRVGSVSHAKRHKIDSLIDHKPIPGAISGNVVTVDSNGLPVNDSGFPISALSSGLKPVGPWDASGGTYPTPTYVGDFWWISVAGTIGGVDYDVHDWLVYVDDSPDTWKKIDNVDFIPIRQTKEYFISQEFGSDVNGDGGIERPFATIQHAIDNGVYTADTMSIVVDMSVNNQSVSIPYGKKIFITGLGTSLFENTPTILNLYLNDITELSTNNISIGGVIEAVVSAFSKWYIEECLIAPGSTFVNLSSVRFIMHNVSNGEFIKNLVPKPFIGGISFDDYGVTSQVPEKVNIYSDTYLSNKKIKELANGTDLTDAINLGQLNSGISSHAGIVDAHHKSVQVYDEPGNLKANPQKVQIKHHGYDRAGNLVLLTALTNASVKPVVTFGYELDSLSYDKRVQITHMITSLTHNGTYWVLDFSANITKYQASPPGIIFDEVDNDEVIFHIHAIGE